MGERRYAASQEMPFVSLVHLCYACIQDLLFVALKQFHLETDRDECEHLILSEVKAAKLLLAMH